MRDKNSINHKNILIMKTNVCRNPSKMTFEPASFLLQIAQPPFLFMFQLVIAKPFAKRVKRKNNADPDHINYKKWITLSGRYKFWNKKWSRCQPLCKGMPSQQVKSSGEKVDQQKMKNVIKEWNASVYRDEFLDPIPGISCQCKE